jgi:hypothetical protein
LFAFISQQTENKTNDSVYNFYSVIFLVSMLWTGNLKEGNNEALPGEPGKMKYIHP